MPIDFLPVPADGDDRIREAVIDGFVFTETGHAPLMSLERHAHERATIIVLLAGVFEESYRARKESCVPSSVLFRPAGEPHADHFGRTGGYNLVIEIALLAGFSGQSHFTHTLKRELGLTPAQFVRQSVAQL
jgi:AraC-like DNA-binding protein